MDVDHDLLILFRGKVDQYFRVHQYETALFWADKAASLSSDDPGDVHQLAQCMYNLKQFERAAILIMKKKLHLKFDAFRYLAAKCYFSCKNWQFALDILENTSITEKSFLSEPSIPSCVPSNEEVSSSLHLLKGDIYTAME